MSRLFKRFKEAFSSGWTEFYAMLRADLVKLRATYVVLRVHWRRIHSMGLRSWFYGIWFKFRNAHWVEDFGKKLGLTGKLFLPFGVGAQYIMYLLKTGHPSLIAINIFSLAALGIGQVLSAVRGFMDSRARPRVRDVHEIRSLLVHVNQLRAKVSTGTENYIKLFREYGDRAFAAACQGLCSERNIRLTFMVENTSGEKRWLGIEAWHPPGSRVNEEFRIPLEQDDDGNYIPKNGQGAAGYAYGAISTIYVPNTRRGYGFLVTASPYDGTVYYDDMGKIWLHSQETEKRAGSVLSVPVFVGEEEVETHRPLAVLNFEAEQTNAFIDADFHLACSFANMLAQVLRLTIRQAEGATP